MQKFCPECETWFTPEPKKKGRSITCSPKCGHERRRKRARVWSRENQARIKERQDKRYRKNNVGGTFFCPYCRTEHNTPTDPDGHKWQYCYPCRENFELNQMPADEWAESCNVAI